MSSNSQTRKFRPASASSSSSRSAHSMDRPGNPSLIFFLQNRQHDHCYCILYTHRKSVSFCFSPNNFLSQHAISWFGLDNIIFIIQNMLFHPILNINISAWMSNWWFVLVNISARVSDRHLSDRHQYQCTDERLISCRPLRDLIPLVDHSYKLGFRKVFHFITRRLCRLEYVSEHQLTTSPSSLPTLRQSILPTRLISGGLMYDSNSKNESASHLPWWEIQLNALMTNINFLNTQSLPIIFYLGEECALEQASFHGVDCEVVFFL